MSKISKFGSIVTFAALLISFGGVGAPDSTAQTATGAVAMDCNHHWEYDDSHELIFPDGHKETCVVEMCGSCHKHRHKNHRCPKHGD